MSHCLTICMYLYRFETFQTYNYNIFKHALYPTAGTKQFLTIINLLRLFLAWSHLPGTGRGPAPDNNIQ